MAGFKVDTIQMKQCADQIQSIQWDLQNVQATLGLIQLNNILQLRAGPVLMTRITDCLIAVGNQSNNLGKLHNGLEAIAELYKKCEGDLKSPKTAEEARKDDNSDLWEDVLKFFGKLNAPLGIGTAIINLLSGDAGQFVSGLDGLLDSGADLIKSICKISDDADAVWWKEIFGFAATEKKTFSELLEETVDDFFPGSNAGVAGTSKAVAKWAGVVLSFVGSGIDNYGEFEGDLSNGRFWTETITEGAIDVGIGIAVAAGVGALLGGAPAIVVAGVGAGVCIAADWACEQIFGKDVAELIKHLYQNDR